MAEAGKLYLSMSCNCREHEHPGTVPVWCNASLHKRPGMRRFAQGWDTTLVSMYRAVQRCAPKPVLSTYPSAIAAPPAAQTAEHTAQQSARRLTAKSTAVLLPARDTDAPVAHEISSNWSAVSPDRRRAVDHGILDGGGSISTNSSNNLMLQAAPSGTAQPRSARKRLSITEEAPTIRICTGDFSGGPNKGVFRFAGQLFSPRGRAVRVPFAAGTAWLPGQSLFAGPMSPHITGQGCRMDVTA